MDSLIEKQKKFERDLNKEDRKINGVFFTNEEKIIEIIIKNIKIDETIFSKKILEPSCGNGIFLTTLIKKISEKFKDNNKISSFIKNNIYFNDIDENSLKETKENIRNLYFELYKKEYNGSFNSFSHDYTLIDNFNDKSNYFDYIIGNPPYVSLYGRRDQKKNEDQRVYYLNNYKQFPKTLKNGKINLVMIFIEKSILNLKEGGELSFIIDIAFFETAYIHLRKYLLDNTQINEIIYDIDAFEDVASGQVILKLTKGYKSNNTINIINYHNKEKNFTIIQDVWNNETDFYKFRIQDYSEKSNSILDKINKQHDKTLKQLYPSKNLRTGTMLLNMENEFVLKEDFNYYKENVRRYPYYRGSKSIKAKYSTPITDLYFYFDEDKKETINDKLQEELKIQGIKNKKRLGFGDPVVYDNPKIYIRQSAKELIATYDENISCSNNSLYIFSLKSNSEEAKVFLKFLTGFLNSSIATFIAQKRRIIRFNNGKQPQIKTSDLYEITIPIRDDIINKVSALVDLQLKEINIKNTTEIDNTFYEYYLLNKEEIKYIEESIIDFII